MPGSPLAKITLVFRNLCRFSAACSRAKREYCLCLLSRSHVTSDLKEASAVPLSFERGKVTAAPETRSRSLRTPPALIFKPAFFSG